MTSQPAKTVAPPAQRRRSELPWRAPKSGGYTVKHSRPEPAKGPNGTAGTSTPPRPQQ
jgi:hypothetical protein